MEQPLQDVERASTSYRRFQAVMVCALLGGLVYLAFVAIPPTQLTIYTAPVGGTFHDTALKYQASFAARGITLDIRPVENITKLDESVAAKNGPPTIGFAASELQAAALPNVRAAGTIQMLPLFGFLHQKLGAIETLTALRGHRIILPPELSITSKTALRVLALYGVDQQNATIAFKLIGEAASALQAGQFDAGFFILAAESSVVYGRQKPLPCSC